jgi:hypothetical protein
MLSLMWPHMGQKHEVHRGQPPPTGFVRYECTEDARCPTAPNHCFVFEFRHWTADAVDPPAEWIAAFQMIAGGFPKRPAEFLLTAVTARAGSSCAISGSYSYVTWRKVLGSVFSALPIDFESEFCETVSFGGGGVPRLLSMMVSAPALSASLDWDAKHRGNRRRSR